MQKDAARKSNATGFQDLIGFGESPPELTDAPASVLRSVPMIRNEQPGLAPDRRTAALLRSLLLLAA